MQITKRANMLAGLMALWPLAATAQQEPANDDIYELSAFEVRVDADTGYRATQSMTATRIGTELVRTPLSIQVVTDDFVEDLGLESFSDSLRYVSSTTGDALSPAGDSGNSTIRGFPTAWTLRNGYRRFTNIPMDNIDRVEIVKGPVSVFFGQAAPGGITNVVSKKPEFFNYGEVKASYGSYDLMKGSVALNRVLVDDKLAARVYVSGEDSEDWRDFEYTERIYVSPSILARPFKNTSILIEYEYSKSEFNNANANIFYNPIALEWYENPPAELLALYRDRLDLLQRSWRAGFTRWQEDYERVTGERIREDTTYMPELHPSGWAYNGNGPGAEQIYETHDVNIDIRQRLQDWLELRIGGNWNESTNSYANFPSADRPWPDGAINLLRSGGNKGTNKTSTIQSDLLFRFRKFGALNKVLVGYERVDDDRLDRSSSTLWDFSNVVGTADPYGQMRTGRQMYERYYPYYDEQPGAGAIFGGWSAPTRMEENNRNGYYVSYQGAFLEDRLNVMAGVRYEEFVQKDFGELLQDINDTTYMGGFTFEWIKGFSLFGSYSENFQPNRGANVTGVGVLPEERESLPSETGNGIDVGVKIDAFDGKLSGMVTFFNLERQNIRARDDERTDNDPRNQDGTTNVVWYGTSGLQRSQGTEWELIYTPVPAYQLIVSYSWMWEADLIRDANLPPDAYHFQRRLRNAPEHKLSLWNKYTFVDGPLTGFEIGFGMRYSDEHFPRDAPSPLINDSFVVFDGLLAYKTEIRGMEWRFSLNLENITDELYQEGHTAAGDPFKARFTAAVKF